MTIVNVWMCLIVATPKWTIFYAKVWMSFYRLLLSGNDDGSLKLLGCPNWKKSVRTTIRKYVDKATHRPLTVNDSISHETHSCKVQAPNFFENEKNEQQQASTLDQWDFQVTCWFNSWEYHPTLRALKNGSVHFAQFRCCLFRALNGAVPWQTLEPLGEEVECWCDNYLFWWLFLTSCPITRHALWSAILVCF